MSPVRTSSRKSPRTPWTRERLVRERAVALSLTIEPSSKAAYSSALQSYISFCTSHHFPIEPTVDTLSFFIVFMCSHIKPQSVESYLSGISSSLEPFYSNVRDIRRHHLVTKTLAGCKKMHTSPVHRKEPLDVTHLARLSTLFSHSLIHDDLLFLALLFTGFYGLLRLGELVWPDRRMLQDFRKTTLRHTVDLTPSSYAFLLPGHKADRFFHGSQVLIHQQLPTILASSSSPIDVFKNYLSSRDKRFPFNPELWLREDGSIPLRSWFMRRLRVYLPTCYGGHSLRAGGATALAGAGVPPHLIQAAGRWSSETFQVYIRTHPMLLASLLCRPSA